MQNDELKQICREIIDHYYRDQSMFENRIATALLQRLEAEEAKTGEADKHDAAQETIDALLSDARELVWRLANLHVAIANARTVLWPDINMMDQVSVRAFNELDSAQKTAAETLLKFPDRSHGDWMKRSTNALVCVPEGFCIMPKELTAENGAKAALIGEFTEEMEYRGKTVHVDVSWTTIKEIYKAAVSLLAAPQPPNSDSPSPELIYEDELPESITQADYVKWFDQSRIVDGVRMGPRPSPSGETKQD